MNNFDANKVREKVMLQIRLEYWKRAIFSIAAYSSLVISFVGLSALTSLENIFANMYQGGIASLPNFLMVAIRDTEVSVQVLFFVLTISLIVLVAKKIRPHSEYFPFAQT